MATTQAEIRQQFVDWRTATNSKNFEAAYVIGDIIRRKYEREPGDMRVTGTVDGFAFEWTGGEIVMATIDAFQMVVDMEETGISLPWNIASIIGTNKQGESCVFMTRIDGDELELQWGMPAKETA